LAKKSKNCPFCGVEVKKENLEKHFLKAHSDLSKKDYAAQGIEKPEKPSKKDDFNEEKKGARKRQPRKKDRAGILVPVIVIIVIISLMGYGVYTVFIQNADDTDDGDGKTIAVLSTSLGTIEIELYMENAPITAGNFKNLVETGFYNGLIFHRVKPDFVIQGGGFKSDGSQQTAPQIPWEDTGLLNKRYTLSMARSGDANNVTYSGTGTSQFFINTKDNPTLDSPTVAFPYVVFAKVVKGFSVVDTIEALTTGTYNNMQDWPDDPPVIISSSIED
jgi:cyclophilin family peptidyl-prolyl cis-trans isomerase